MPDDKNIPPLPKGYEPIDSIPALPKGYFDIKKKIGSGSNGIDLSTESNPFLSAKQTTATLPITNLSYAQTINKNKQDNGSEAANEYIQKSIEGAEKADEDRKWEAANNSAALYFKNNPVLLHPKDQTSISLKNIPSTVDKYSIKNLKNATPFQTKAAQLKSDIDNGKLITYQTETGEHRAAYPMTGLQNTIETFKQSWQASDEAKKVLNMDDATFKKYATYVKPDEEFLPTKSNAENVSGVIGSNIPVAIKGTLGAAAGATLAAAAEPTFGVSLAGLGAVGAWALTAPDMANMAAAQSKIHAYKTALAQGHSEDEAMKIANSIAVAEYAKGLAEGTALNFAPAFLPKNTGQGVLKAMGEFAAKQPYAAGIVGLGAGELTNLKNEYAKHLGLTIDEAEKNKEFNDAFSNMAGMQIAFNVFHGAIAASGYVKAQSLNAYSKLDPNVRQELSKQAVEQGWVTQEQADAANRNLAEFEAAKKTIIPSGNEEKDAVISGLIQKRKNLEVAKKNVDAAYHPELDAQIESANKRIQLAKDSDNPIRYAETDDVEGSTNFPTKTFDELTRPEKNNIEVPKEFGVTVIKPNQNERFTATIESGGKEVKVEGDFASKESAQKAADDILKQNYYDNELAAIEKPESKTKIETKEPIKEGDGRSAAVDEQTGKPTVESLTPETSTTETIQAPAEPNSVVNEEVDKAVTTTEQSTFYRGVSEDGKTSGAIGGEGEFLSPFGTWVTNDKKLARGYAGSKGQVVEVKANLGNIMPEKEYFSLLDKLRQEAIDIYGNGDIENINTRELQDKVNKHITDGFKKSGYDSAKINDGQEVVIWNGNPKTDNSVVDNTDFDFLKDLTDKELDKRLNIVRQQQDVISKKIQNKEPVNDRAVKQLYNQETAIINENLRRTESKEKISSPINTEQNAIRIKETTSEVLRPKSEGTERNMELRRVEQGDKSKIVATKEKETINTKDKDIPLDDLVGVQYPPTQLSHGGTERIRGEFGGEEAPIKEEGNFLKWEKEADDAIESGYDVGKLLDKMQDNNYTPSPVEHIILTKQADALAQKLRDIGKDKTKGIGHPEFDATLEQIDRIDRLSDIAGSKEGKGLVARRFKTINDDSLVGFLLQEKELNKGAPLTDNQKNTAINEFEAIKVALDDYKQKFESLQADYAKLLAEREVKKQAASTNKNPKKTHEDFVKERAVISQSIKDKLKKARQQTNVTVVPYANELIVIAPDVAKLAKSLIDEGIVKLEEVVKNIHAQLKEDVPEITEKDVHDIIAGVYNEKKKTRSQVAEQWRNLRTEAQLLKKLNSLLSGEKPKKNSRAEEKYNQEVHALKEQIKEWQKENPDQEAQLQSLKKRNETELKKIEAEMAKGDFAIPAKKVALSVNNELKNNFPQAYKEALASQTKLIKAKQERDLRRAEQQFKNLSDREKFRKGAARYLNVPRTLMASMDYSAPLRQAAVATVAHPFTAARAFKQMIKHGWSQEEFDRYYHELKESPDYDLMIASELPITDPHSLHLNKQEEDFLGGNVAEKIPIIGRVVKASERAYVSYLNKMRVDLFHRYAEQFITNGKTFENSPELYKALGRLIGQSTGRGRLGGSKIEAAAPILNSVLFSPRLIASRMNLLTNWANPRFYKSTPFEVRKLYFQDMAKFIGVGLSTLALAKYGLGADVELDPRSSDFGKIKIGNIRWDIWGGFQQYIRVFSQLLSGQRKTELGLKDIDATFGESRADVLGSFGRGKLAPIPSLVADILSGRTSAGEKVNRNFNFPNPQNETSFTEMALSHLSPLLFQDVIKAAQEQGIKAIFTVGIPATFGIGVQNYQPSKTAQQFDLKDKDWQFLIQKTGKLPILNENQVEVVDEDGKRRSITDAEFKKFTKLRNEKIKEAVNSLRENGATFEDADGLITEVKKAEDMTTKEISKWLGDICGKATIETKSEMFGDNEDVGKVKIKTNE